MHHGNEGAFRKYNPGSEFKPFSISGIQVTVVFIFTSAIGVCLTKAETYETPGLSRHKRSTVVLLYVEEGGSQDTFGPF